MKKWTISCLFAISALAVIAQGKTDEAAVREAVLDLFHAMRAQDTAMLGDCFVPEGRLLTTKVDLEGVPVIRETAIAQFKSMVAASQGRLLDEQVTAWDIRIDGNLAAVWADYLLYVDGNFVHCGVDAIQLARVRQDWKIVQVMDTRRKEGCIERPEDHLQAMLNRWHHAAATADEEVFFGMMASDGVYIGTDATERWTRDEMRAWSAEYFDRETAWDFKVRSRQIAFSENGRTAWFDELLDTWMGDCRGSGVLVKTDNDWKITHYHLSIAVPNEKVQGYLKLLEKE